MKNASNTTPWSFLDEWRGKIFTGEWPTLPEMLRITVARYPDRPCFTDFSPNKHTLTYSEVLSNVEKLSAWLSAGGVKKGTHVAVSGKNRYTDYRYLFKGRDIP